MESLDLNGLAKSLPASNFEKAEKELLNNFKGASLLLPISPVPTHIPFPQRPRSASPHFTDHPGMLQRELTMLAMHPLAKI